MLAVKQAGVGRCGFSLLEHAGEAQQVEGQPVAGKRVVAEAGGQPCRESPR
jgi:hypothetical protein